MMQRGDFKILHEPFSYLYYVHEQKTLPPFIHIDNDHPKTYLDIKSYISSTSIDNPIFFKDFCFHCFDYIIKDENFLCQITHTFLIRDPAKAIASHYAIDPGFDPDEIGYEQEFGLFKKIIELTKKIPPLIDADDLENNPSGIIKAYCNSVEIPYIPESLQWELGFKKEWDTWKEYHADVAASTSIHRNRRKYKDNIHNNLRLKSYYQYNVPFYQAMFPYRLTI